MFFLLFYILNPFLWHISLNKSRLISAIFVLRKSYRGIITNAHFHLSHLSSSDLASVRPRHSVRVLIWSRDVHVRLTSILVWDSVFSPVLEVCFSQSQFQESGRKRFGNKSFGNDTKKKVCKLSFYFNHRLRYFLVVIYVTVLILYITLYVMISGLHQVFMQSKKIFSIPSRLVVALKFIILTNGLFPY